MAHRIPLPTEERRLRTLAETFGVSWFTLIPACQALGGPVNREAVRRLASKGFLIERTVDFLDEPETRVQLTYRIAPEVWAYLAV